MKRFRSTRPARSTLLVVLVLTASVFMPGGTANATLATPVGLGTATSFAIHAGISNPGITNTTIDGPTTLITGNVGLQGPFANITGLACVHMVVPSIIFSNDGAGPAPCSGTDPGIIVQNDARAAFNTARLLPGASDLGANLAGQTLVAGLYSFTADVTNLSGTLTLNAQGDPNAVWILQASSTLITSPGSTVAFSNLPAGDPATVIARLACNVYWTVPTSATIDTTTNFVGTILAGASITVNDSATVTGRLLAGNDAGGAGAVTLIDDTITIPTGCSTLPAGSGGGPPAAVPTPVVATPNLTG